MNAFGKGKRPSSGLSSLLERSQALSAQSILEENPIGSSRTVPIDQIVVNPQQPRRFFDPQRLEELAESIKQQGILQPLMVRHAADKHYEIVFGERRYRAARLAGLTQLPVIIRDLNNREMALIAALENLQREDLNRYDEVVYKLRLVSEIFECSEDEAIVILKQCRAQPEDNATKIGELELLFKQLGREQWRSFVVNGLPVLNLPLILSTAVREGQLDYSKATLISRAPAEHHSSLLTGTLSEGWTQDALKAKIADLKPAPDQFFQTAQRLKQHLSSRRLAQISPDKKRQLTVLLEQLEELLA